MPKKGFISITIRDKTKQRLDEFADKIDKSVPATIEYLLENCEVEA